MSTQAAVNRLIAAAITHAEAVRSGQGASGQQQFLAAVDAYVAQRDPIQAARDAFLAQFPTADRLAAALDDYERARTRLDPLYAATLHAEARASAALDGDTIAIDGPVSVAPDPDEAWLSPAGFLCCPKHTDGCPSGDNYFLAWHRMRLTAAADIDDPETYCGKHTGNASNRCGLREGHRGDCDDLGGDPVNRGA